MPRKLRELIADLERAGFGNRGGKGSHRNSIHPRGDRVTLSGPHRRWIGELAGVMQVKNPLPDTPTIDDVDAAFTALLARLGNFVWLMRRRSVTEARIPDWLDIWDPDQTPAVRRQMLAHLQTVSPAFTQYGKHAGSALPA